MLYNGSSQNIEVYDGSAWMTMTGTYPTIELSGDVQAVVNWARTKMAPEVKLRVLAAVKKAQEQLDIVGTLVEVR